MFDITKIYIFKLNDSTKCLFLPLGFNDHNLMSNATLINYFTIFLQIINLVNCLLVFI